jgi:hypothetical protein
MLKFLDLLNPTFDLSGGGIMQVQNRKSGIEPAALLLDFEALAEVVNPDFNCGHLGNNHDCPFICQWAVCSHPGNEGMLCCHSG